MALAKKGSRLIVVAGTTFRWVASGNDGVIDLIVESAAQPGQRLEAVFRYHNIGEPTPYGSVRIVGQRRSISPGVVAVIIQAALSRGWEPAARGKPAFRVLDADELAPLRL